MSDLPEISLVQGLTLRPFSCSPSIAALVGALALAQGEMTHASKDRSNPAFKSKYADLASVIEAARGPLSKNGIAFFHTVSTEDGEITVTTVLAHKSGEYLTTSLSAKSKDSGPQAVGSVITYLRRYGLMALAGIAPDDDDDGNAASGRRSDPPPE